MPLATENLLVMMGAVVIVFMIILSQVKLILIKRKYNKIKANIHLSGIEVARTLLDKNNLPTTYILENIDRYDYYYDTNKKTIKLPTSIFNGDTLWDISIASYLVGYVLNEKSIYFKIRNFLIPFVNIISYVSYLFIILTIFGGSWTDLSMTVIVWGIVLLFHLITIPLEYKAIKTAYDQLIEYKLVNKKEKDDISLILETLIYNGIASMVGNIINLIKSLFYKDRNS